MWWVQRESKWGVVEVERKIFALNQNLKELWRD